jgi:hypothetical protein
VTTNLSRRLRQPVALAVATAASEAAVELGAAEREDLVQSVLAAINGTIHVGLATAAITRPSAATFPPTSPLDARQPRTCRVRTVDGLHIRECVRPARFIQDGLEVCITHVSAHELRRIP